MSDKTSLLTMSPAAAVEYSVSKKVKVHAIVANCFDFVKGNVGNAALHGASRESKSSRSAEGSK